MRTGCWVAAAAVVVAASAAGAGPRAGEAAARREIEAGERAWGQALVTGDVARVDSLLTDDFVGVWPSGETYGKAQALAEARATPHLTSDQVTGLTIRFYGDTAVAQAREQVVGSPP